MMNNGTFGEIDRLSISYNGNQLMKVTDAAEALNYNGALDFNDAADTDCEYEYDSNGALIKDSNRGINSITYDYGHHPYKFNMNMPSGPRSIQNDYASDGRKLSSRHVMSIPKLHGYTKKTTTDLYIDGLILRNGKPLMWQFDGGYVELDDNATPTSWNYYVTDHLGSTRKVVDSNNNVKETINYYPFGSEMRMQDPAQMAGDTWQPYRFTGKELDKQNGLNWYDFGARWYDVAGVPMWTSVDPLAEKYYNVSPYAYCAGDPVNKFDPDGKAVETAWDFFNVGLDVTSCLSNVKNGNYTSAAVDAGAAVVDLAAAITPFVPGGVGTALKTYRTGKAAHTAETTYKATKNNYRKALQKATGKIGDGYEAHHTLPQKHRSQFEKMDINIDEPGNVVWRETKDHRKNNSQLTKDWDEFMERKPTKEQVMKKRDNLENKYFGNKEDNPNN
jgi:RHS repeat-associated protein